MRSRLAALLVAALLSAVACTGAATPAPTPTATQAPASSPTAAASPSPTATPTEVGRWEPAGSLAMGRAAPLAIALGGGALVVGNDACGSTHWAYGGFTCDKHCVRDDSRRVETWGPTSGWEPAQSLRAARADFAAVPLADGRALVTGGVGPVTETDPDRFWRHHVSFAGASIFDPTDGTWTPTDSPATARTAPIAAVLDDGRVLVAGGYDLNADTGPWTFAPGGSVPRGSGIVLAAHRTTPVATAEPLSTPSSSLANMTPQGPDVFALATAELYDPATDTWSATGPLRYARFGQASVTLTDGRVLVVPGEVRPRPPIGGWVWGGRTARYPEQADSVAEVYDPETGRFELAGSLPEVDWPSLARFGYQVDWGYDSSPGTLVALADGGALLVGRTTHWSYEAEPDAEAWAEGVVVRTLRFEPLAATWTEVDRGVWVDRNAGDDDGSLDVVVPGHARAGVLAARLPDGRVLVAGGLDSVGKVGSGSVGSVGAELYDPATNTWSALPPMPESRVGGSAVALADGSVLLVGGQAARSNEGEECGSGSTGVATSVRFVPEP